MKRIISVYLILFVIGVGLPTLGAGSVLAFSGKGAKEKRDKRKTYCKTKRTRANRSTFRANFAGNSRSVYRNTSAGRSIKKPSLYRRHRNAFNIAIGSGAGALVGALIGGKKGALIGAGAGAGGAALYTYKLKPKKRKYRAVYYRVR
ncbi:MAG: hypothetical protein ACK5NT_13220 [Pyrinomonadaceae bacterium]